MFTIFTLGSQLLNITVIFDAIRWSVCVPIGSYNRVLKSEPYCGSKILSPILVLKRLCILLRIARASSDGTALISSILMSLHIHSLLILVAFKDRLIFRDWAIFFPLSLLSLLGLLIFTYENFTYFIN